MKILAYVEPEIAHFILSFVAGLLAYLLMSLVLRAFTPAYSPDQSDASLDSLTRLIFKYKTYWLLILALAVAVIAHVLEDQYFGIF